MTVRLECISDRFQKAEAATQAVWRGLQAIHKFENIKSFSH